jgi:hypothetical protein
MKKILIFSVLAIIAWSSCKKQKGTLSQTVTVSYPIISFKPGFSQFYSFPVGSSALPDVNSIAANVIVQDTFYTSEQISPIVDASTLSSVAPGLYIVTISARNSHGFVGYNYVYVAITNITDSINLGGKYMRVSNGDTVNITKLARGLYRTNNVGGVINTATNAQFIVPAYFAQLTNPTMDMPTQPTPIGSLSGSNGAISMAPSDTTIQYVITGNSNFGPSTRLFKKL